MEQYFPIVLIALFAVVLFVLPARQRKRMAAKAQALQESLAIGTPVMTTSGLHGTVAGIGDKTIDLEIAPGVVVTFARQAILEVRKPVGDDGTASTDDGTPARPADVRPTAPSEPGDHHGQPLAARRPLLRRVLLILAVLYALVFFTGSSRTPQLGLDLRGGTTVTLTARTPNGKAPAQEDLELARQIIEQRVNGLGVAEAEVVTEGNSNIVISVPGDNGDQARELGQTAQLRFRPVITGPRAGRARRPAAAPPRRRPAPTPGDPADAAAASTAPRLRHRRRRADRGPGDRPRCDRRPRRRTPTPRRSRRSRRRRPTPRSPATAIARPVDRPDDYVAACSEDGRPSTCSAPPSSRAPTSPTPSAGTRQATGEWIVQLDFNNAGSRHWASTPPPTSASRSASPSTAASSPPRRSTPPSPAAPRSRAASTRRRPPSWPTSSSTAPCR